VRLGATPDGAQTNFVVWAPGSREVAIEMVAPEKQRYPLARGDCGYFMGSAPVGSGARYHVVRDNRPGRPDPASRFQPEGVHGPSEIVSPDFNWTDSNWRGIALPDYVIYELHIGTFSAEGTFDGALAHLDELKDLGVTAIEIMPVAQFPGTRNWGYDGVQLFAVQNSYGGPAALKRLVDACHQRGIAVVLDVVYNHVGPEGNYLGEFGPYFTEVYKTPWGPAVNVDGALSDPVRRFFIENALEWITDYHIDALRLDAVHGILDTSAYPFLAELSEQVQQRAGQLGRAVFLIAESDFNDVRMISPVAERGLGMAAQWTDDFHHSLHALLTREDTGYYADFGSLGHLAQSLREGYVYQGQFSQYRQRRHGNSPRNTRPEQFVVCLQNHDQVGNRMNGDRIATLVDLERQKLGAAVLLLSPFVPLLFMGEEYGETQPFPYFIDHSDQKLVNAVRKGRKAEFASFAWQGEPPDPYLVDTFDSARLRRTRGPQPDALRSYYRRLLQLRSELRLAHGSLANRQVIAHDNAGAITVVAPAVAMVFAFDDAARDLVLTLPSGQWRKQLSSRDQGWLGSGDAVAEIVAGGSVAIRVSGPTALLFVRTS
jgi:maltooligosyltrehalose trehalohydrolase